MIEIKNLTKTFGSVKALNGLSLKINDGSVFGLVGSNGAGKSTLLRILSGVYTADEGEVLIDGENPYDNTEVKGKLIFVSDYPFFAASDSLESLAKLYRSIYPDWSDENFERLKAVFPIDSKAKINRMSKGMQRQAAIILGLSAMPKYIFFDEIFDGLDPVIRELLKKLLIEFISENGATVVIASHNLRELEDLCDSICLLHIGGALVDDEIDNLKLNITRVQFALENPLDFEKIRRDINIIKFNSTGKIIEFTARGSQKYILGKLEEISPSFVEVLPLTLEEVFISEMEVAGYDINKILG